MFCDDPLYWLVAVGSLLRVLPSAVLFLHFTLSHAVVMLEQLLATDVFSSMIGSVAAAVFLNDQLITTTDCILQLHRWLRSLFAFTFILSS